MQIKLRLLRNEKKSPSLFQENKNVYFSQKIIEFTSELSAF